MSVSKFVFGKNGVMPKLNAYFFACHKKTFSTGKAVFEDYKTMTQLSETLAKVLSVKEGNLNSYLPLLKPTDQPPPKKMKDSFDYAIIPLSKDQKLRLLYSTFFGNIRIGRLMEDLDMFAGWCCVKHLSEPNAAGEQRLPYFLVTIRVDHIEFLSKFQQADSDIRLSGHICWVGKSSLDVLVWVDQNINGEWHRIMKALLLFAVRERTGGSAGVVNPIVAETDEEKALLQEGEARKLKRMEVKKESLLKKVPTEAEHKLIHDLFIKTIDSQEILMDRRTLPPKSKWMHDATLNNLVFCHPEFQNVQNKIFGGFLMRQALELSWSIAYIYGMRLPTLVHISDIAFYSPVEVGSLLQLYSSVCYSEDKYIEVFVHAVAQSTVSDKYKSTNSFYFTYDLGSPCDKLYPSTYFEAMKYIDGRRHFNDYLLTKS